MKLFIDKLSKGAYVPRIGTENPADQRLNDLNIQPEQGSLRRQDKETNRTTKEKPMSSLRNFAVQAAATLTLTAALGAFLFNIADLATRGVVIS